MSLIELALGENNLRNLRLLVPPDQRRVSECCVNSQENQEEELGMLSS